MRLPSLPVVNIGLRWVSLLAAGMVLFVLYYLFTSPSYRVDAAEIHGLRRISGMAVNTYLDISGEPVFTISPEGLYDSIVKEFDEFSHISVEVGLPNTVVISVTERIPVLAWVYNGGTKLVDADGLAFSMRGGSPEFRGPVVEALDPPPAPVEVEIEALLKESEEEEFSPESTPTPEPEPVGAQPFLTPEMVTAVMTLAKYAPEKTPIVYDSQHGFGWHDPRGWDVFFGFAEEIDIKLLVYAAIVERMLVDGIQPVLISVEHAHAPFYRLER